MSVSCVHLQFKINEKNRFTNESYMCTGKYTAGKLILYEFPHHKHFIRNIIRNIISDITF